MTRRQPRRHPDRPTGLLIFLTGVVVIGIVALGLSVLNAVAISNAADDREAERIEADLFACERRNALRTQVIDIAAAQQEMVERILGAVRADGVPLPSFDDIIADYEATVRTITLVDCHDSVPGATSTSLPQENP